MGTFQTLSETLSYEGVLELARAIGLELIEAPRALPVLDENDYRRVIYYVQHFQQARNQSGRRRGDVVAAAWRQG